MQYKIISQRSDNLAKWSVVALGFSIPISTTLDNVLLLFIFLLWLLGAEFRSKLTIIKSNPIAILALVIFGLYVLGLFYGDVSIKDAMESLTDAAHFLLIPLLIPLFKENRLQHHALWGFLSAMLLTLAFSYLIWLDLLPQNSIFKGTSVDPVVFKFHITHSIFMAFAAFLFALKARHVTQWPVRLSFATLSALAIHNVLFMVQGKTGHLVMLFLIVYFFINWLRWKGIIVAAAFIVSLSSVLYFTPSSALNLRFTSAVHEFSEWNPEQAKPGVL
jgi:O-antigen ligase